MNAGHTSSSPLNSTYSWLRLATALFMSTVGSVAMWSVVVVLPTVQAEFGTPRADASLPFTMTMMGFAVGNVGMGWLADRFGIVRPLILGACSIALGYFAAALAPNIWIFALAHLLTGFGVASLFGPLIADCSHWFLRWRGFAVAVAASGNYLAGTVWPVVTQKAMLTYGWRPTHIALGIICLCIIVPLSLAFRRRLSAHETAAATTRAADARAESGVPLPVLHVLLAIAAFLCCVAMATPQAHLVAYCGDLGYGVQAGAEMLTLMLGFGVVSRLASGLIADKIGGLMTLLVGSLMQAVALALYLQLRRPDVALRHLNPVRPVPGRHRAELCDHRARIFPAAGSGGARRHRVRGQRCRHGVRRLGGRMDFRSDRVLPRGLCRRLCRESFQSRDRGVAALRLPKPRMAYA